MNEKRFTVNRISNFTFKQKKPKEVINLDEIFGWYLNITFAVLFVFIIANFLFKTELRDELREAKRGRISAEAKLEDIKKTSVGEEYEKREKTLIELQKQQLILALNEIEKEDRAKFGLSAFSLTNEDGRIKFNIDGILSGDKIFDNSLIKEHFIEGSKRAKQKLPYVEDLAENWRNRVLLRASKNLLGDGEVAQPISQNFETVEKKNLDWLVVEIKQRIEVLRADFCELQAAVVAKLYGYYFQNPKLLDGTETAGLLDKYFQADSEKKLLLVAEIEDKLYRQAKAVLEAQGVELLTGVQGRLAEGGGK